MTRVNTRISAALGDTATVKGASVTGIFSDQSADRIVGDFVIKGGRPIFACAKADLPDGTVVGEPLTVVGHTFEIREFDPPNGDETGWVQLVLKR